MRSYACLRGIGGRSPSTRSAQDRPVRRSEQGLLPCGTHHAPLRRQQCSVNTLSSLPGIASDVPPAISGVASRQLGECAPRHDRGEHASIGSLTRLQSRHDLLLAPVAEARLLIGCEVWSIKHAEARDLKAHLGAPERPPCRACPRSNRAYGSRCSHRTARGTCRVPIGWDWLARVQDWPS